MRVGVALVLILSVAIACDGQVGGGSFREYEYEEEMYLSLDGSATIYVNSSVPALVALRDAPFDPRPTALVERREVREYFASEATRVPRVSLTRRRNRRFVHVRIEVVDLRGLGEAEPFRWSTYHLERDESPVVYRQVVGAAAGERARKAAGDVRWTGDELVAFRIHVPSEILYHNAGPGNLRRGNILVWEQPLAARLQGVPVAMEVRMRPESILYRTLLLFGATIVAVATTFGLVIWWIARRGAQG